MALKWGDHVKRIRKEAGTEHTALPASSPSKGPTVVCSGGLDKNVCSFNSFQRRTVVHNRRILMAAFHLASYPLPRQLCTELCSPGLWELNMASPALATAARVSPQHEVCYKMTWSFTAITIWTSETEHTSKSQHTITMFLNRDILNHNCRMLEYFKNFLNYLSDWKCINLSVQYSDFLAKVVLL